MMNEKEYLDIIGQLKKITNEAFDKYMSKGIKSSHHKTKNDLLTDTDLLMDEYIKAKLKERYPSFNLLTEESLQDTTLKGLTFVVDPVDGTCNFANGMMLCGIQIALFENEKCVLSLINLPYFNEIYYAILNGGAFLNDKKLLIKKDISYNDGILELSDFYPNHEISLDKQFNIVKKMQSSFLKTRLFGAAVIDFTNLATSKVQAYICYYYHIWDIAPGLLIATEAGGVYSSFNKEYHYNDNALIVCNNSETLKFINEIVKEEI